MIGDSIAGPPWAPRRRWLTLTWSCVTGLLATGADLLALFVLVEWVGVSPQVANVPTLLLGATVQFAGNKDLAFGDRTPIRRRQLFLFGLVEAGTLAGNGLLFHALVTLTPASYPLARLLGSLVVYVSFSYPSW